MSSRTVIDILKDNSSKEAREESRRKEEDQQNAVRTNYTKALRLFKKGKNLLDVTIELGILAEETEKAFLDFSDMNCVDDFRGVYEDIKPYLPALLHLWKMMREKGLGVKDAIVAIEYANNLAKAEKDVQIVTNEVSKMETILGSQKMALKIQIYKSLVDEPPPPKAAKNEIVAAGDQPTRTSQMPAKPCSGDYKTAIKD